ncbi:MAG: Holliday junction branch migration protein RuvA [Alphaproteobacteria bacterium]
MIALLTGILAARADDHCIIDVNGVGYATFCSSRTLDQLPMVGEAVRLHIDTHVREDHIHLYGFMADGERQWFRLLQSVQGVGARVALGILGTLSADELAQSIATQDKAMVGRAQGVGPKLAQRLVTELKDKVPADLTIAMGSGDVDTPQGGGNADALSALTNLGYKEVEAARAIAKVSGDAGDDVASLIRLALKELAPNRG